MLDVGACVMPRQISQAVDCFLPGSAQAGKNLVSQLRAVGAELGDFTREPRGLARRIEDPIGGLQLEVTGVCGTRMSTQQRADSVQDLDVMVVDTHRDLGVERNTSRVARGRPPAGSSVAASLGPWHGSTGRGRDRGRDEGRSREADCRSYPSNLSFAPIDFETTTQREGLANAGFDFNVLTFFALLGVTQYLTNDAIEMIFQFVESTPAGSELVFEFIVPDELMPPKEAAVFAAAARLSAERGEPWLARLQPGELRAMLDALGFAQVTHCTPEAATVRMR